MAESTRSKLPRRRGVGNADLVLFGSLLTGLRKRRYDRRRDFCDALAKQEQLVMSERTLGSIETGEQEASFSQVVAFVNVLAPERGIHYFGMSLPPDSQQRFYELSCPPPKTDWDTGASS